MKQRSEMDVTYQWDLSTVYPSDTAWYEAFDVVKEQMKKYPDYKDSMMKSSKELLRLLQFDQSVSRKLHLLYTYAFHKSDEDKTNHTYLKMLGEITQLYTETSKLSAYIVPTFMKYQYEQIETYLKEEPELKEFELSLKEIYRYKAHTLSEEVEKAIATYGNALSKIEETYDIFTNSDMKLGTIQDEENQTVELTEGNYPLYIRSKDRRVRKEAFDAIFRTYQEYQNTITCTFTGMLESAKADALLRHYESVIASYLYPDEIDLQVYNNLINVVNENMDVLMKYYHLKKEALGLEGDFHIYDISVDLAEGSNKTYTFEEASDIVKNALSVLGEDYVQNLEKAFCEHWIDVYPNKGKTSGAYSGGCYDSKPFVLLNFNGTLNDVSTLAHELGHSIHSLYTRTNNGYETGDYPIFVAEIASTVNELLLNHYLLSTTEDIKEKKQILSNLLDLFRATIYRQTMFAEFEKKMHDMTGDGIVLTADQISKEYLELNRRYFEKEVIVDPLIQYEWERIPHLYTPFYVYKYATGLSCACKIVTDILEGRAGARENYIAFLKNGSKDHPKEHLQMVGIDITSKEFIESAIHMFDKNIEEMRQVLES